jgi:hypothetical protein
MLVGLIRVNSVAKVLGVGKVTVLRWLRQMGCQPVKCPVLGMPGRTGTGINQPLYLSMATAIRLVDLLLHAHVDRAVRKRVRARLREQGRAQEEGSRGVRHGVGGTGSGAPPSNLPL